MGSLRRRRGPTLLKGAIFGAYPITVALVSLWVPQLSQRRAPLSLIQSVARRPQCDTGLPGQPCRWGRLPTLLWGIVIEGVLVIIFGFVQTIIRSGHDSATLWIFLLLRIGMGVGEATQSTMLLAYATDHFSATSALGAVMGWQETCAGIGFIVGPAMGGLLDQLGGFFLPFLVIGLMILSLLLIMPFALVGQKNGVATSMAVGQAPLSYRDFKNFDIMNAACATVLMGTAFGSIMPTLAPHLEQRLKLRDAAHVGIAYVIPALVYGVACPLVGEISDRVGYRRIIVFGFSLLTMAFIMMGPIPPLAAMCGLRGPQAAGSLRAWAWAIIAMILFGVGGACGFVPTLPAMERGARALGPAGSEAISGAYWTLYFLGEGIGPFLGASPAPRHFVHLVESTQREMFPTDYLSPSNCARPLF